MFDARALIERHRGRGVLVDTNLLVLLLVGSVNKRRIPNFKRTQNFTIQDYELLEKLIAWLGRICSTPHVLGQVSDLTDLSGQELSQIRVLFAAMVERIEEVYDSSSILVSDPIFGRHGLTDAAIASVCCRGMLVLTADLDLQLALERRGADALNFHHVRHIGWN